MFDDYKLWVLGVGAILFLSVIGYYRTRPKKDSPDLAGFETTKDDYKSLLEHVKEEDEKVKVKIGEMLDDFFFKSIREKYDDPSFIKEEMSYVYMGLGYFSTTMFRGLDNEFVICHEIRAALDALLEERNQNIERFMHTYFKGQRPFSDLYGPSDIVNDFLPAAINRSASKVGLTIVDFNESRRGLYYSIIDPNFKNDTDRRIMVVKDRALHQSSEKLARVDEPFINLIQRAVNPDSEFTQYLIKHLVDRKLDNALPKLKNRFLNQINCGKTNADYSPFSIMFSGNRAVVEMRIYEELSTINKYSQSLDAFASVAIPSFNHFLTKFLSTFPKGGNFVFDPELTSVKVSYSNEEYDEGDPTLIYTFVPEPSPVSDAGFLSIGNS